MESIDGQRDRRLPSVRRWFERTVADLSTLKDGRDEDFSKPSGEPSLVAADSVSWQVFKNPVSILIGGIAAVTLELAEPSVGAGVHQHSSFRTDPMTRLRRTGRATMVVVYGAASRAEAMIAKVNQMHLRLSGVTAAGRAYRASDPELLDWVHATASYGFLQARHIYVAPIDVADQDRFYSEGLRSAALYGAAGAPSSCDAMTGLLDARRDVLQPSPLVQEFLQTMQRLPLVPVALAPLQRLITCAAVEMIPDWARQRLKLGSEWSLRPWQRAVVRALARRADNLLATTGAPVQACRRLGLPDDYLASPRSPRRGP